MFRFQVGLALCLVVMLSGCGGGGSGPSMANMDDSSTTEGTIRSTIEQLAAAANSLTASDLHVKLPENLGGRQAKIDVICSGSDTCSASFQGEPILRLSLSDGVIDPGIELQRAGEQQGVALGEGRGKISQFGFDTDVTLLGGWLDHHYFGAQLERVVRGSVEGTDLAGFQAGYAFAVGDATGTAPLGSASWSGAAVGIDTSDLSSRVQGDANVTFDLGRMAVDVALTNFAGANAGRTYTDMRWDGLRVTNGRFWSHSLDGQFYGPNHEEVGGIFERNNLVGAFGAKQ